MYPISEFGSNRSHIGSSLDRTKSSVDRTITPASRASTAGWPSSFTRTRTSSPMPTRPSCLSARPRPSCQSSRGYQTARQEEPAAQEDRCPRAEAVELLDGVSLLLSPVRVPEDVRGLLPEMSDLPEGLRRSGKDAYYCPWGGGFPEEFHNWLRPPTPPVPFSGVYAPPPHSVSLNLPTQPSPPVAVTGLAGGVNLASEAAREGMAQSKRGRSKKSHINHIYEKTRCHSLGTTKMLKLACLQRNSRTNRTGQVLSLSLCLDMIRCDRVHRTVFGSHPSIGYMKTIRSNYTPLTILLTVRHGRGGA
ncbi:hypothetical protein SAY87_031473 [Trapa incisa]|uniref:Uncharacterized protein n=1 Tax=Trapa incisa TaxID=236973 RepID=A0AAN7QLP2_9MYRT|nr:hypothetical protein SAY87_031473 [Trapa incisa]